MDKGERESEREVEEGKKGREGGGREVEGRKWREYKGIQRKQQTTKQELQYSL